MSEFVLPSLHSGSLALISSPEHRRLVALKTYVHPDGGAVTFTVQYRGEAPFPVLVPFKEIPAILHEIRTAAETMVQRQALQLDGGQCALSEVCRNAMKPSHLTGTVDRWTGDHIYCFQFQDSAPLAIRMTMPDALKLRAHIDRVKQGLSN